MNRQYLAKGKKILGARICNLTPVKKVSSKLEI